MSQPIICPKCGSDDLTFFTKLNQYRCGCGHLFEPVAAPPQQMRIFLSYGHDRNEELVLRIKSDLEALGHDVWLDREEIKFADDWRRTITDGIRNSDWMFSFLSKHSTRDPGVCLDELGIALGVKGGIVKTILVESENEVSPPVSVSHLQWLDMHDWHKRQQDDTAEFADWYAAKFAEIRRVLESETNQRFAGEIEQLNQKLKPVTMDAFTARLLEKGFSGRQWLVDELDEWLQQERGRAFILTGEPGIGKSAFAAWLSHYNKAEVLAAVFMRYNQPQSCNPVRVIQTLAFQLASRLPDYRKQLIHLAEIDNLADKNESELFSYLLTEPLRLCIDGNRGNGIILIDALDEASTAGSGVAELLARHAQELPSWLRIVATTRHEPRLLSVLSALHPHKLDADDQRNRQDIAGYLQEQLSAFNPAAETIDAIVDKSEGIFLYAEQVTLQVLERDLSLERIDEFPVGLPGIYTQYFQRQFPDIDRYHETTALALQVLLSAQEPLSRDELAMVLDWNETKTHRQLLALGSLFPETGGGIQPFHRSLGEWLTLSEKAGEYFVSLRDGHTLLATAGWAQLKTLLLGKVVDPELNYSTLFVGLHLYAARQDDILREMTLNVVDVLNDEITGYEGILEKLIDWVAIRESFESENLLKPLFPLLVARSCNHKFVGILHYRAQQLKVVGYSIWALFLYESNTCILKKMIRGELDPSDLQRSLLVSYSYIGDIRKAQGDSARALKMYRKSLAINEELVSREPDRSDLQRNLLVSYGNVGSIYKVQGDSTRVLEMYRKSLQISEGLVSQEPERSDFRCDLSVSCSNVGDSYRAQGDGARALEMYRKSLAIMKELVTHEPERNDLQRHLLISYSKMGWGIFRVLEDSAQALEMYGKSLQISEGLVAREPERSDLQRHLSVSYDNVGCIYQAQGDGDRALEMCQKSLTIAEELVTREPQRSDLQIGLAIGCLNLFSVCSAADERHWLERAHAILQPLKKQGLCHAQLDQLLALVERELAKL